LAKVYVDLKVSSDIECNALIAKLETVGILLSGNPNEFIEDQRNECLLKFQSNMYEPQ